MGGRDFANRWADTYQCYYNDVAISGAVWSDPTEIVPVGKTWRYVGMGTGQYTTVGAYYYVAGINQWIGKDLQS
ncbi:hypothetical protein [Mycolicibacterium helvum]|uniref:Uncharacterized protein n=1 Tax=Mycolicibacterium helvum TaxID=1534349 RepID=A0A7I7T7G7_9MYCO|nr:hypothetical protein [Mycolicibacterium helvum]BBY65018.1 hypothetical protein MHEL_32610 [Mycolicibacterium helvum]